MSKAVTSAHRTAATRKAKARPTMVPITSARSQAVMAISQSTQRIPGNRAANRCRGRPGRGSRPVTIPSRAESVYKTAIRFDMKRDPNQARN